MGQRVYFDSSATVFGSTISGNVAATTQLDDLYWILAEDATNGLDFNITCTASNPRQIPHRLLLMGYYNGTAGHNITVFVWNYVTVGWDTLFVMQSKTAEYPYESLLLTSQHQNSSGEMKLRFLHNTTTYNASHRLNLNSIVVAKREDTVFLPCGRKYYTGQTMPIILGPKTGTAPTAQIKRADGLYLDFNDGVFKSSGWTTPSVTLTDQTNQWRYDVVIAFTDTGTFVTEVTFGGVVYTEAFDVGLGVNLNASQAVTFDAATFRAFRNLRLAHLLSIEGWYPAGFDVAMSPAMNAGATLTLSNEVIFDEGGTRAIYNQTLGVLDSANTFTPDGSWTDAIYYGALRLQFGGLDATFTGGWLTITASRKSDGTNPETIKLWVPATADDNFYARGDQTLTRRAGGAFDSVGGPLTPSTKRVDVLFENGVDLSAIPELTADPGANPSRVEAETLLYMKSRNKQTATATTETVHNNAGTQILSHAISDSAGTTTKEKLA